MDAPDHARASALKEEQLERFRRMPHREVAIVAALTFCTEWNAPVPAWLVIEAADVLGALLQRDRSNKPGRSNTPLARFKSDMIDYMRWDTVLSVCQKQPELAETVEHLREMSDVPESYQTDREKLHAWLGTTKDRAYECASMMLRGSLAFGGKAAVKASYMKVEKKIEREPDRYQIVEYLALKKVGLEELLQLGPVRKPYALYDLTL